MRRIESGGGEDGDPALSPPGWKSYTSRAQRPLTLRKGERAGICRPQMRSSTLPGWRNFSRPKWLVVANAYFTASSSTSKISVALGGMTPPAPRAP